MSAKEAYRARVEAALHACMRRPGIHGALQKAMAYSLEAGGKRLRPCMLLAACDLCGGDTEAAMPLACALEMIHSYSLIHDDLPCMDDDDFRRGRPSNHKVFGEGMAVLAGDGLLSYAFELIMEACIQHGARLPGYARAAHAIANGAGIWGMVGGQSADLENEKRAQWDEESLLYIHSRKTGALLRAAVLAGVYAADADAAACAAMEAFAVQYGLLFQITDDILDAEGDAALLGKSVGKDERAGKLTYVSFYGLEKAKTLAAEAAAQARAALVPLGEKAAYFHELLDTTLGRKS